MKKLFGGFGPGSAADSLAAYISGSWSGLKKARHLEILIGELEAVERGETKRLLVAMPPGFGKSQTGSIAFAAWFLGRHPDRNVLLACHTEPLATDFGAKVLRLLTSDLHKAIFPEGRVTDEQAAVARIGLTMGGAFYAVGLGGALTGRRADVLVIDDPFKDMDEVRSPANRKAVQRWFVETALPRLKPDGAVVLIQSRFGEDDLIGYVLREHAADEWRCVVMPAIAEKDEGWRKVGESLWPQMYPVKVLNRIRGRNAATWRTLYQQDPGTAEGVVIKREWWRFYREAPQEFSRIVMSADTAFSAKQSADYSAITVWGETKTGFYLLFAWRGRPEFPELKKRLVALAGEWRPNVVLIENKASGQSLIQELQRETSLPIKAVDVSKDKTSRAAAVTPTIEAGRCYLPDPAIAPFVPDFLDEISAFPTAPHDDWVDSTTMALEYMRGKQGWASKFMEDWRDLDSGEMGWAVRELRKLPPAAAPPPPKPDAAAAAIDRLKNGRAIECTAAEWEGSVRERVLRWMQAENIHIRAQIASEEIRRLDALHQWAPLTPPAAPQAKPEPPVSATPRLNALSPQARERLRAAGLENAYERGTIRGMPFDGLT